MITESLSSRVLENAIAQASSSRHYIINPHYYRIINNQVKEIKDSIRQFKTLDGSDTIITDIESALNNSNNDLSKASSAAQNTINTRVVAILEQHGQDPFKYNQLAPQEKKKFREQLVKIYETSPYSQIQIKQKERELALPPLPDELLPLIFETLSPEDNKSLLCTSKKMAKLLVEAKKTYKDPAVEQLAKSFAEHLSAEPGSSAQHGR